jgi:uncharacterized protein involved in type VI secretion and phage assembly
MEVLVGAIDGSCDVTVVMGIVVPGSGDPSMEYDARGVAIITPTELGASSERDDFDIRHPSKNVKATELTSTI